MRQEDKKQKDTKPTVVGQHMLKLLTEKEKTAVAGGPRGPVRAPGNPTHN